MMRGGNLVVGRHPTEYMYVTTDEPRLLSVVLDELIKGRAKAKAEGRSKVAAG